jgi:hypothetical protein
MVSICDSFISGRRGITNVVSLCVGVGNGNGEFNGVEGR